MFRHFRSSSFILGSLLSAALSATSLTIQAEESTPAANAEKSAFTGHIYAIKEDDFLKYVTRDDIVYTVDHDAIQRVVVHSKNDYSGVTIYPLEDVVLMFRRNGSEKYFTQVTIKEYLEYMENQGRWSIMDYDRFGFGTYFNGMQKNKDTLVVAQPGPATYDEHPCQQLDITQPDSISPELYTTIHCDHLGIPREWLRYTELRIPEEVTGFPFKVTLRMQEKAPKHVDESKQEKEKDGDSGLDPRLEKALKLTGKALTKTAQVVSKLNEFTYRVVRVVNEPVTKTSFFQEEDFIRVDSIATLRSSFSDFPKYHNSGGSHNWFD
ncbi:hypothetical protein HCH_04185 [Hahella chejuensis KCTC 2396]|uniref:DUF4412 domain-containing protein n=1 Tax=Hahella chejuensis (strain KCTC 2396) TaxID=349521 RepID=Q2SEN2_HAHCH|nr:hypothetical protein [Hahella chejuensis]ABC30892.1 hypothetical protein HCH_04185 [Hahella chejuensis KCTC 2396]